MATHALRAHSFAPSDQTIASKTSQANIGEPDPGAAPAPKAPRSRRLALEGRYMLADRREFDCIAEAASASTLTLRVPEVGAEGSRIVAYIKELGRIEGITEHTSETHLVMKILASPRKRDRLAGRIGWLVRRAEESVRDQRAGLRDERRQGTPVTLIADGSHYDARLGIRVNGHFICRSCKR